eukprot:375250_1
MDQCHCFLFHLFDMSLRYRHIHDNINDIKENNTNNLTDIVFKNMYNTLNKTLKANGLNKYKINQNNKYQIKNNQTAKDNPEDTFIDNLIAHMNDKHISPQRIAKFISEIETEQHDTDSIMEEVNNYDQSTIKENIDTKIWNVLLNYVHLVNVYGRTFSPGHTFYYWNYYKNSSFKQDQWWVNRNDHSGYMENELYIEQKYTNLKEEIMNNTIYCLNIIQINTSVYKVQNYLYTRNVKSMKTECPFGLHYGIKNGLPLKMENILSIILYTDWSKLCTAFSQTFRLKNSYESIQSVKNRNKEYAIWSRIIRETVECFGEKGYEGDLNDSTDQKENEENNRRQGPFYCGMSLVFVFPSFNIRLCGPTSTSLCIEVATRFSTDDGIIIKLNNYGYESSCELRSFDCHWLSNYGGENEILFIGGHYCIKIENITNVSTHQSFKLYCEPFFYFDCCIKGMHLEDNDVNLERNNYSILNNLFKYKLNTFTSAVFHQYVY